MVILVNLIKTVKNLYKGNKVYIKAGKTVKTHFKTWKSLLQGCLKSSTLFEIFLEHALIA